MISVETKTLEERGLPSNSFFTLHLHDGTIVDEHTTNWSDISDGILVSYFGDKKKRDGMYSRCGLY